MRNQVPSDPFQQPVTPDATYNPAAAGRPYPPQPYAQPAYNPYPGFPPPPTGTNGFAIASLVSSICGGLGLGTILGMGFGIAALVQLKRNPQKGRGLAIAGIVVSTLTLLATIALVVAVITDEARDKAAGITDVEAIALKPGDCIREFDESSMVYDLPVVPCTQPHTAEVYHVFTLPSGPYPGESAVEDQSGDRCGEAYEPYDTVANEELEIYYLHPLSSTWSQDRGVTCVLVDPNGTRTTSIVK